MAAEQFSISAMVVDHKLDVGDTQRRYMAETVRRWKDGPVTVTLKRERPDKSTLQMGYYRALVLPMIVEEICGDGDNLEENRRTHVRLKAMFLPPVRVEWTDKETGEIQVRDLVPSLGDLNTVEMAKFTEDVRQWAREFFPLEIPEPDKRWKEKARKTA